MKKILFYLPFIKVGGIEKVSIDYMQGLIDNNCEVDLIIDFDMGPKGNSFEHAIPNVVDFQYIKTAKVSKFIYWFRTAGKEKPIFNVFLYAFMLIFDCFYYHTKVKGILKNGKYDYSISFFQFLPAYITSHKETKHIIWIHGSVEHFFGGVKKFFKNSYGKKLEKYSYVVTIAEEMKEQLELFFPKLPKYKIKMIYNPFNFEVIIGKSKDESLLTKQESMQLKDNFICSVSRIDETQKDNLTLINAYEKLHKEQTITHKLYIIGDGPDKVRLESLVKEKGLSSVILFLGKKINPFIWMRNSGAFILSSKFEGFGLVLVEAMAVETFVISSNCKTGPKEILQNGKCGSLFGVGDHIALAHEISHALLISSKQEIENKIILARNRVNEFTSENAIKQLLDILE